jgi:hypothetical protein
MEIIWKCKYKYCNFSDKSRRIVAKHEDSCVYNLKNKLCPTCKYHYYSENENCEVLFTCPKSKFIKSIIMDNNIPCKFWEAQNNKLERKLKINKILNK